MREGETFNRAREREREREEGKWTKVFLNQELNCYEEPFTQSQKNKLKTFGISIQILKLFSQFSPSQCQRLEPSTLG